MFSSHKCNNNLKTEQMNNSQLTVKAAADGDAILSGTTMDAKLRGRTPMTRVCRARRYPSRSRTMPSTPSMHTKQCEKVHRISD